MNTKAWKCKICLKEKPAHRFIGYSSICNACRTCPDCGSAEGFDVYMNVPGCIECIECGYTDYYWQAGKALFSNKKITNALKQLRKIIGKLSKEDSCTVLKLL
jgi:Zn ribbon nucleic-acid-binding protein